MLCALIVALSAFFAADVRAQLPAGRVVAWGDAFLGQTNVPPNATNVVAISARGDANIALKSDGQVLVWPPTFVSAVPPAAANSIAVAAGVNHFVALRADGRVIAWGAEDSGQTNVPIAGLSNVTAIAAGAFHNLAVREGIVFGWGSSTSGKLVPPSGNNFVAVAAGLEHSVALRNNGTLAAWGANNLNQIAIPADAINVKAIAAGENHTLALRSNGTVRAWGANNNGQLNLAPLLSGVMAIGAGDNHSFAVLTNGTVIVWGNNSSAQTNVPPGVSNIIAAAGGGNHSIALQLQPLSFMSQPFSQAALQGATVTFNVAVTGSQPITYRWRKNGFSINNATNNSFSLFNVTTNDIAAYSVVVSNPVGSITSTNATLQVNVPVFISQQPTNQSVGVGSSVTFRVVAGGTTPIRYQWRRNGTNIPLGISSTYSINNVQLTNAGTYTVLVSNDFGAVLSQPAVLTVNSGPGITQQPQSQTVIVGGSVTFSVIATNADGYEWRKDGAPIPGATDSFYAIGSVQQAHAGNYSVRVTNQFGSTLSANATLTVTVPGAGSTRVVGWGEQLVWNGTAWIDVSPPVDLGTITAVAVGGAHSLALRSDGRVVGWGDNTYGQAGPPPDATNVIAIAAGLHHSVALRGDGRIVAWGRSDNFDQTAVPAHSGVIAIVAGANHSLAVQTNGVVVGWGRNDDGRATPHPSLGPARNVGAGSDHSLGVRTNTTVRGWGGQNLHGETLVPPSLSNVIAVAAGANHSMALRSNGTVVVWGNNTFGQTNVPAFGGPVKAIASGSHHCLALLQNGSVAAWGNGNNEQTNTPALTGVIAIAAGANRNLVVKPKQLLLQRPERLANGRYRLTLSNDDGVAATPEQLARVQVFGATNLTSSASWIEVTNTKSLFGGAIRLEDTQTNLLRRFYRARENP
jgi:trimeric autotransporter adhesin